VLFPVLFQELIPSIEPSLEPSLTSTSSNVPILEPSLTLTFTVLCPLSSTVPSLKSSLISSPVPSLETSTAYVNKTLPPSSVPSLEPTFDSSYVPSLIQSSIPSMEPILETSTVFLAGTVNDDGPTKAIISSYCHNLRLPVGTEIFILLFAVPNSEPSPIPSLEPRLILSNPTVRSRLSSPVPSLVPSFDSSSVPSLIPSPVRTLKSSLMSTSSATFHKR
jgi:hypothetical protein